MPDSPEPAALADAVLLSIREVSKGIPLAKLIRVFEINADRLGAVLDEIRGWGYEIEEVEDTVRLVKTPDILSETEITYGLRTEFMGRKVYAYQSVPSTNDTAAQLAGYGEPEGTIVTAEKQTAGRGRLGRVWHSPPGTGIYLSILLRPSFKPAMAPGMAIVTALALAETLETYTPSKVKIKWPNDVLIDGKKAAGILTELSAEERRIDHLIVGAGINVNHRVEDFPEELRSLATSVRCATGTVSSRVSLLQAFLTRFETEYLLYRNDGLAPSQERLRNYSSLIGQRVKLAVGQRVTEGRALDIDSDGCLVVETDAGIKHITSGEVTIVKR